MSWEVELTLLGIIIALVFYAAIYHGRNGDGK